MREIDNSFSKIDGSKWSKIIDNDGTIGWVSSNYLTIDKDDGKFIYCETNSRIVRLTMDKTSCPSSYNKTNKLAWDKYQDSLKQNDKKIVKKSSANNEEFSVKNFITSKVQDVFKKDKELEEEKEIILKTTVKEEDNTPPSINCESDLSTENNYTNIKCKISDNSEVFAVVVNGEMVKGNLNSINKKIQVPFGKSEIVVLALDKYGNEGEYIVNVDRKFVLNKTKENIEGLFPGKIKDNSKNRKVAIIIGIKNYTDIPNTKYSDKDAMAFTEFANKTLNINTKNIKYMFNEDAKFFGLKGIKSWLENKVDSQTDVYVFYSGHGLGVEGKSKLLPSDFATQFQEESSYEKDEFLSDIANLNPNHIYAFFDTCFSGLGRDGETLIAGLKNISIVEETAPVDNITIFNSSSGLEYSTDFDEAGHGLFSYYLMKGLEGNADINSDNEITIKELFSFIKENVSDRALDIGLSQNPSLIGDSDNVIVRW